MRVGQEPDGPMTLLGEAAASRTAHVKPAGRAGVARGGSEPITPRLGDGHSSAAGWLRVTWARVGARLTAVSWRRAACFAAPPLILLSLPVVGLAYHVYFDRSGLPDLEPFIRFEPPDDRRGLRRPGQRC